MKVPAPRSRDFFGLLQPAGGLVDASFLMVDVGMYVQVERSADIGVAQQGTHGFVVAAAFYAAGGETVPEPVKADERQPQRAHQPLEVGAEDGGLGGFGTAGEHEVPGIGPSFQGSQLRNQLGRKRDFPIRVGCFGAVEDDFTGVGTQINALKGLINTQEAGLEIKVGPGERANFAYAQSRLQTDGDAQIVVVEV